MSIIVLLIILSALILVHEFGHFYAAKKFGIRVDEFGLGLPPRAKKLFSWKGTDFTLNWLPFGGFVKIFGENPSDESQSSRSGDNFQNQNRGIQAIVLSAGIIGNLIFAWVLLSLGLMIGLPISSDYGLPVNDPKVIITSILPGSPAELASLQVGESIISLSSAGKQAILTPQGISDFVAISELPLLFRLKNASGIEREVEIKNRRDLEDGRQIIGITMDIIGIAKLPPLSALWHGFKFTTTMTVAVATALVTFISQAILGTADFSSVAGPVGLVGIIGEASILGFVYLLSLTAIISVNLALINLVPFPALDGGRLLFVAIEAMIRRPIPTRVVNTLNTVGFALLIFLMILVTAKDVRNIF
jgi:regulator of sigma E protease